MKQLWKSLFALLFTAILLVGCGQESGEEGKTTQGNSAKKTEQTEKQEVVTVVISKDNGKEVVIEEEVAMEEGATVLDVMKTNFKIEETKGFITSIEGLTQDEEKGKYWMYSVNDKIADVGAAEYELEPGDQVTFDLQVME
ncbi:DUF4430 domain-containing protein [Radiobacillus deserti]|uniref:DUF4430 domain-containing protein n=1 Tax=Radiobacillus deserti TaxID=2594883 RepID=A0A516KGI0_9BACI|nr:DUF4430 domain-containing protein [Radiobacillus deserti]QDP40501.1 DUF4430 domain-containing protein [Radiobacillus deserti]